MIDQEIESQDRIRFASIESLVPGARTDGLALVRPGLYVGESAYPEDTRDDPQPISVTILKRLTDNASDMSAYLHELSGYVRGKAVVDLGAGKTANGYRLALLLGAKGYIANEGTHFSELRDVLAAARLSNSRSLPACVVGEDMRKFMERFPDDSVAVFAFGIDGYILDNKLKIPPEGVHDLAKNISRSLASEGAYIGSDTSLRVPDLHEIYRHNPGWSSGSYVIRTKKQPLKC